MTDDEARWSTMLVPLDAAVHFAAFRHSFLIAQDLDDDTVCALADRMLACLLEVTRVDRFVVFVNERRAYVEVDTPARGHELHRAWVLAGGVP